MVLTIEHLGLYFGQAEIDNANSQRDKQDNLQSAWQWLLASEGEIIKERKPLQKDADPIQVIKPALTAEQSLIEQAFRYRFADDIPAGESAAQFLQHDFKLADQATLLETITHTLLGAHAFEMLRDLMPNATHWLNVFADFTGSLLQAYDEASYQEKLWLIALSIVSGVVLEDAGLFENGTALFRHVIDNDVHPEGYFKPLVANATHKETAFGDMVLACAALTLAAEAATQAGENLWQYENRDVGINTAVTYLVYYYFYPDKWRWGEDDLTEEQTQAIFADLGAWIEISTRRVNPRGVELLLDDQRPFFNAYMGGLTTLSHFETKKPKLFGLFG